MAETEVLLDASTFQHELGKLAEVLAQKVRREAPKMLRAPLYVSVDLHVLVRQALYTYSLLCYLNADERRETDCYWRNAYTIVTLPLIRNMIDSLYNITAILEDPATNGPWFRKSGFKKVLLAFDEEERRYGGRPEWDAWLRQNRDGLDFAMRDVGMTKQDAMGQKPAWPTLGVYLANANTPAGTNTPLQKFLATFMHGKWREYSAMAHGAFEGLMLTAMYYISDAMLHEDREKIEEQHLKVVALHIPRAAALLLCIITELQAYFHFDDDGSARVNQRIHAIWNALVPVPEIKELYDERYSQLMKDSGINA